MNSLYLGGITLVINFVIWQPCNTQYSYYDWNYRIYATGTLEKLQKELLLDSLARTSSVQYIKTFHGKSVAFQMGEQMGHVKTLFKRMIVLHERTKRNSSRQLTHWPQSWRYYNKLYVKNTVEMQHIRQQIDQIFRQMEHFEIKMGSNPHTPFRPLKERRNRLLRRSYNERQKVLEKYVSEMKDTFSDVPTIRPKPKELSGNKTKKQKPWARGNFI